MSLLGWFLRKLNRGDGGSGGDNYERWKEKNYYTINGEYAIPACLGHEPIKNSVWRDEEMAIVTRDSDGEKWYESIFNYTAYNIYRVSM